MFFALAPEKAFLSDANKHLIDMYSHVARNPDLLHEYLKQHKNNNSEAYYYNIRTQYNSSRNSAAQAARFIYLNKACFNGIFRVNIKGMFNVPYGWKEPPSLPSRSDLRNARLALRVANISCASYEDALRDTNAGDFVYLDPPYPPLNGTSFFTHYTPDRFSAHDQARLASLVQELDSSGCKFMLSNADIKSTRLLYKNFSIRAYTVRRWITSGKIKHKVSELLITNY